MRSVDVFVADGANTKAVVVLEEVIALTASPMKRAALREHLLKLAPHRHDVREARAADLEELGLVEAARRERATVEASRRRHPS